ncbi:hypothetical protein QTA58_00125 [Neorhizobium sp. CSC1952]|uniref:hypothetical protein n=1 Tax=Neorhizobium sp. CSC1952 TaxID=2978974 RepID=UPI0025A64525|nr:hypothetical protein [Rhizobium sp. CSC1952]WJR67186.1 hypothetical protein QTA58_23905 [Rhizobium sp. CSC1952]WJR67215.1 hypothetical protein QTA58_00125 [Rhizobium sp. CSC1952]
MVASIGLNADDLQSIADEVARSLSYAMIEGRSAFITTAVNYPNGSSVVVRIDHDGEYFFVSDDGQANLNAELFGGLHVFARIASEVAKRFSVEYDQRSFFILQVRRNQLPAAVAIIANASSSAVDRTIQAMERLKIKASRELFVNRITEAFGDRAVFDAAVRGSSKEWEVDAAVIAANRVEAVFEFVTPAPPSIAFAHMKIGDISAMFDRPRTVIVLSDYDRTDAPMRQILSSSADSVVAAKASLEDYRKAA